MKKFFFVACLLLLLFMFGCTEKESILSEVQSPLDGTATPHIQAFGFLEIDPSPVASATPSTSPTPVPSFVTIGAVGDIALDSRLLTVFEQDASGDFSFTDGYQGMLPLIDGVDFMCGNLETPLAGAEAGYSGDARTPNAFAPESEKASYAFNAPDALAFDLKSIGFDFVTTANNHFSDRCYDGVLRTLDVLDQAELLHAGTYRSEEERNQPCIAEINGFHIGLLACNNVFNSLYDIRLRETPFLICSLRDRERIQNDVRRCREAGAEIVIMFAHWDEQYQSKPSRTTRKQAEWLLSVGVDIILGSHPHVVQPMEYMSVMREDGPYTGLVVYSLGNSLMRMQDQNRFAQLFVRLTIERGENDRAVLTQAEYAPVFSAFYEAEGRDYFEVLPAWENATDIPAAVREHETVLELAEKTRLHVQKVCGTDAVPLMEKPED